jgi:hypothetical protein
MERSREMAEYSDKILFMKNIFLLQDNGNYALKCFINCNNYKEFFYNSYKILINIFTLKVNCVLWWWSLMSIPLNEIKHLSWYRRIVFLEYWKENLDCTCTVLQHFTDFMKTHDSRDEYCPTFSLATIHNIFMRHWRENQSVMRQYIKSSYIFWKPMTQGTNTVQCSYLILYTVHLWDTGEKMRA